MPLSGLLSVTGFVVCHPGLFRMPALCRISYSIHSVRLEGRWEATESAYKLLPIRECQSLANHNVSDMIIQDPQGLKAGE
jgi:hypothetical protein